MYTYTTNMNNGGRDGAECAGSSRCTSSTTPVSDVGMITHQTSKENLDEAHKELTSLLSSNYVVTDPEILRTHSSTKWSPAPSAQSPALVVKPGSTSDVSEIMKICSRRRIPVTAYSGGTSFAGALTATRGGICIDFAGMDKIVAIHEKDMDVVVQPGVGWQDLNRDLEPRGLFFPPDPGAGARIGGMVRDAQSLHFLQGSYRIR